MKQITTSILIFLVAGVVYLFLPSSTEPMVLVSSAESISKAEKLPYQGIKGSWDYFHNIRANQNTGEVDLADVLKAREQADRQSGNKSAVDLVWQEQGPNNVGGRIRALVIDKDNPNKLYTGGVSGGVFVSTNRGQSWNFIQSSVDAECTTVCSMVQLEDGSLLVGTGSTYEFPSGTGGSGFAGSGLYRMTSGDGGYTFSLIDGTEPGTLASGWSEINRLITAGGKVYAATGGGLFVSSDNGETWAKAEGTTNLSSSCHDVQASGSTVYAIIGAKLMKADDGVNFTEISGSESGQFPSGIGNRKVLTVHPSNANVVYVATLQGGGFGCLDRVFRSTNGGETFSVIGVGGPNFDPTSNFTYCQGSYDFAIAVDPSNENRIMLAGISLWTWEQGKGWRALNNLFENPSNPNYIHADLHYVLFDPNNSERMYVCSDGGVFFTAESSATSPGFEPLNKGLNITQFYGMGAGHKGEIIAGSQDNGTQFMTKTLNSSNTALEVRGGDGGYSEVSNINPLVLFGATQNGDLRRSSNRGESFSLYFDCVTDHEGGTGQGWCQPDQTLDGGAFITPYLLWEDVVSYYNLGQPEDLTNLAKVFTGNTSGDFFMTPEPLNLTRTRWVELGSLGGSVSAFGVNKIGTLVFAGSSSGMLIKAPKLNENVIEITTEQELEDRDIDGDNDPYGLGSLYYETDDVVNFTDQLFSGRYITGISIDPTDDKKIVISCGGYGNSNNVFYSENATSLEPEFVSIQANLPEMPVYDVTYDPEDPNTIVAATELGVWTYDFLLDTWTEQNSGLGRIPVLMARFENINLQADENSFANSCNVLYIGTHGRGVFKSKSLAPAFPCSDDAIEPDEFNITGIENSPILGEWNAYPNPLSDMAVVTFSLEETQQLSIDLFDLTGKLITNVIEGELAQGNHSYELRTEGLELSSGNYMLSIRTEEGTATKQLTVVR